MRIAFWAFLLFDYCGTVAHRPELELLGLDSPIQLHRSQRDAPKYPVLLTHVPKELAEAGLQGMPVQEHWKNLPNYESQGLASYSPPGALSFSDVSEVSKDLSKMECPDGVLTLHGRYELKSTRTFNCSKVVAHDAFLELGQTLAFNSELVELEGNLSLQATAEGFHCLKAKGKLMVNSGSLSISDCKPKVRNEVKGSAIWSKSFLQKGGNVSIRNCRAEGKFSSRGGAIYTNTFNQTGGSLLVTSCEAVSKEGACSGGAIFAVTFLQTEGSIQVEDCAAISGKKMSSGGAVHAAYYRAFGGKTIIQDCTAGNLRSKSVSRGGAIASDKTHVEGEAQLTIRRCKAFWGGRPKHGKERGGLLPMTLLEKAFFRFRRGHIFPHHSFLQRK